MPVKGSAEYTDHLSVAVTPEMKQQIERAARRHGVRPAVVARWAISDYLEEHFPQEVKQGVDGPDHT